MFSTSNPPSPTTNPPTPTAQATSRDPLSWWSWLDDASAYWASGHSGRYFVVCRREWAGGHYWTAEHQRGRRVRQLGVAATLEQAKALAQRDHDLAPERRS
jgi:hypothetical protein